MAGITEQRQVRRPPIGRYCLLRALLVPGLLWRDAGRGKAHYSQSGAHLMTDSSEPRNRYSRIAPLYDLVDLPFEYFRYRRLRRILCGDVTGTVLEAGVGTGRNLPYYPSNAVVTGIDLSPAMLERACRRATEASATVTLLERDVRETGLESASVDCVVSSFMFCVMPDAIQPRALAELARVCRPGGTLRLLEYTRPTKPVRRAIMAAWEPYARWAFGVNFDSRVETHLDQAGWDLEDERFVADEVIRLIVARRRENGQSGQGGQSGSQ